MNTLALADQLEIELGDAAWSGDTATQAAAELRRLHAEVEALKAELIEQCKIIGGSAETELRLRAENEAMRKEAAWWRWLQNHALAIDTVADPDNQVQIWHGTDPARCTYGKTLSEAVDKAMKEQTNG